MLLNLTNHPHAQWPEKQRTWALETYSSIQDMPFPIIPPEWTPQEVLKFVEEYAEKIKALAPTGVHVMGEMTFCFALIQKLQQAQIPCIASTTRRLVSQSGDIKTSQFEFVQFRAYTS